jgi:hypothetical protein
VSTPTSCGCDPLRPPEPVVQNPPAQPALAWRVAPHSHALARMRAALADPAMPDAARRLAGHGTDDAGVALLDAWALVADTVSFYTERIAQEGFLRTATELRSVRLLARAIGYELSPGVAAEAEIAFEVEDAPGAPGSAAVAAGTPVQSVPGQDELPQTFETSEALEARAAWNAIPATQRRPQELPFGTTQVWVEGTALGIVPGAGLLIVGAERRRFGHTAPAQRGAALARSDDERWDFRPATRVEEIGGWTLVTLERRVGYRRGAPLTAAEDVMVHTFDLRVGLFGGNAPDPKRFKDPAAEMTGTDWTGIDTPTAQGTDQTVELDGDHPEVVAESWMVLEDSDYRELYLIRDVSPGGAARFGMSGKITRARVDMTESLTGFGRRGTVAYAASRPLPGAHRPNTDDVTGATFVLQPTDPPLPLGRRVVVAGFAPGTVPEDPLVAAATPPPLAEAVTVVDCEVVGEEMTVTVDPPLQATYDRATVRVRANVVTATHGETVEQVLGSGDATVAFQRLVTRRGPLTHVRAKTPSGTRSTLEVRVDDVRWDQVPSLDVAGPRDRVVAVRALDDWRVGVTAGGEGHGARLSTGSENVRAVYRVGIGAPGAVRAGQLSLLPRRPLGIRGAVNPAAAHDWAPPEELGHARVNAPLRIRTLDRAVSVADHADFAADFAGVALSRADAVWDGRETVVVVSVLGTAGAPVSDGLIGDLRDALADARDAGSRFEVLPGEPIRFGVRVEFAHDPAYERTAVETAVRAALAAAYTMPLLPFAAALPAARVLVTVRSVPGVLACTMPRLVAGGAEQDPVVALPARFAGGALTAAQVAGIDAADVVLGAMPR